VTDNHEHSFPVQPPAGSVLNPGPCECGRTYKRHEIEEWLARALSALAELDAAEGCRSRVFQAAWPYKSHQTPATVPVGTCNCGATLYTLHICDPGSDEAGDALEHASATLAAETRRTVAERFSATSYGPALTGRPAPRPWTAPFGLAARDGDGGTALELALRAGSRALRYVTGPQQWTAFHAWLSGGPGKPPMESESMRQSLLRAAERLDQGAASELLSRTCVTCGTCHAGGEDCPRCKNCGELIQNWWPHGWRHIDSGLEACPATIPQPSVWHEAVAYPPPGRYPPPYDKIPEGGAAQPGHSSPAEHDGWAFPHGRAGERGVTTEMVAAAQARCPYCPACLPGSRGESGA